MLPFRWSKVQIIEIQIIKILQRTCFANNRTSPPALAHLVPLKLSLSSRSRLIIRRIYSGTSHSRLFLRGWSSLVSWHRNCTINCETNSLETSYYRDFEEVSKLQLHLCFIFQMVCIIREWKYNCWSNCYWVI